MELIQEIAEIVQSRTSRVCLTQNQAQNLAENILVSIADNIVNEYQKLAYWDYIYGIGAYYAAKKSR